MHWSGNYFTLDISKVEAAKIVLLAGSLQKQEAFGGEFSLYMDRLIKIINQHEKLKSFLIIDEFTILFL